MWSTTLLMPVDYRHQWFTRPTFLKLNYTGSMFNNSLNFLQIIEVVGCWGIFLFLIRFISKRKHLLRTLLRLEGLILIIFMLLSQLRIVSNFYNFLLIFLSLVACEGALGLSLLVLIVRNYSRDYFKSINSLKC